jgi:hypothetical protein
MIIVIIIVIMMTVQNLMVQISTARPADDREASCCRRWPAVRPASTHVTVRIDWPTGSTSPAPASSPSPPALRFSGKMIGASGHDKGLASFVQVDHITTLTNLCVRAPSTPTRTPVPAPRSARHLRNNTTRDRIIGRIQQSGERFAIHQDVPLLDLQLPDKIVALSYAHLLHNGPH